MKPLIRVYLALLLGLIGFWVFDASLPSAFGQSESEKPAATKKAKGSKGRQARKKVKKGAASSEAATGDTATGDTATGESEPGAALVEEEGQEEPELTEAERAALEAAKKLGTVPDFAAQEQGAYNAETEDDFYNESIRNRRDDDAFPSTSLVLRSYADSIVEKYDYNKDGVLQESEWSKMAGAPQAMDMNGDFVLEGYEILYYLGRYAKDRTIFRPVPPVPLQQRHMLRLTDRSVLIRPLSGKMRVETAEAVDKAKEDERLADLTEDELTAMVEETDEAVGTEDDPELFGLLVEEMDESKQREYAAPLEEIRGMPVWFLARDINGDGQLSLREFAPGLSLEATAFFGRLDADSDGFVTPDEVRKYMNNGGSLDEADE